MTTTIKYEFSISKNDTIKERRTKNEHDLIKQSLSYGKILRTQSRILNNKLDENDLLVKNEYTYRNRNKGFENFNMNKVCGSSYHKHKKNIVNKLLKQIGKNNLNENIKVIKEYKLNYAKDILDEDEIKMDFDYEKINPKINKNVNGSKIEISKNDYYTDKDVNFANINKNNLNKNTLLNYGNKEIKFHQESFLEIKNKNKLIKNKNNKIKYLISQKCNIENTPFNIKNKILNINGDKSKPKNKNNSNIFLAKNNLKKMKYSEENNKAMDKISSNKIFNFWNQFLNENNNTKGNKNKRRKINNLKYYNNIGNNWKKNNQNYIIYSNERTMNLINKYEKYKKDKFIMPPNNLKSILFKKINDFFDL